MYSSDMGDIRGLAQDFMTMPAIPIALRVEAWRLGTLAREAEEIDQSLVAAPQVDRLLAAFQTARQTLEEYYALRSKKTEHQTEWAEKDREYTDALTAFGDSIAKNLAEMKVVLAQAKRSATTDFEKEKLNKENNELRAKLIEAGKRDVVRIHGQNFREMAVESGYSADIWGPNLFITAGAAILYLFVEVHWLREKATPSTTAVMLLYDALPRVLIVSIFLYLFTWMAKNYSIGRHNQILNRLRGAAVESFDSFSNATEGAVKAEILRLLANAIFSERNTGYLAEPENRNAHDAKSKVGESPKDFIELAQKVEAITAQLNKQNSVLEKFDEGYALTNLGAKPISEVKNLY